MSGRSDSSWPGTLVKNFVLLGVGELVSKVFGFLAFAYLARVLGPSEFGQLEFVLALIFFFTLLVDCGLGAYGAREIARDDSVVVRLTAHILFLRSLLAIIAIAGLFAVLAFLEKSRSVENLIVIYGLTLLALPGLIPWVFQGRDLMRYVALASVMRWSIFATGVLIFVGEPSSTWLVPIIDGAAIVCVVSYYFYAFKRHFGVVRQQIDYRYALSILREALPIGASELVWVCKVYFATVLLGIYTNGPEIGWFGAAHRVVISLHTFVWLYFFNLFPSISRGSLGAVKALQDLMQKSMQVAGWLGIFVGMVGTLLAQPVMTLMYGLAYQEAVTPFRAMIWLIPLALVSGHFRYALIAYNHQRLEFLSAACGAALNVLLNLFLIPAYGILGAAWSLIASESLILGLSYLLVCHTVTRIPLWSYLWRPLIGAAILAGALFLLPPLSVWVMGGIGVTLYFIVLSMIHHSLISDVRLLLIRSR